MPGLLLGLAGGAALGRFARGMFYDVSPGDPATFAAVSGICAAGRARRSDLGAPN